MGGLISSILGGAVGLGILIVVGVMIAPGITPHLSPLHKEMAWIAIILSWVWVVPYIALISTAGAEYKSAIANYANMLFRAVVGGVALYGLFYWIAVS